MVEVFPHGGGTFQIEPDASSASYFHALNAMFPDVQPVRVLACQPPRADVRACARRGTPLYVHRSPNRPPSHSYLLLAGGLWLAN